MIESNNIDYKKFAEDNLGLSQMNRDEINQLSQDIQQNMANDDMMDCTIC